MRPSKVCAGELAKGRHRLTIIRKGGVFGGRESTDPLRPSPDTYLCKEPTILNAYTLVAHCIPTSRKAVGIVLRLAAKPKIAAPVVQRIHVDVINKCLWRWGAKSKHHTVHKCTTGNTVDALPSDSIRLGTTTQEPEPQVQKPCNILVNQRGATAPETNERNQFSLYGNPHFAGVERILPRSLILADLQIVGGTLAELFSRRWVKPGQNLGYRRVPPASQASRTGASYQCIPPHFALGAAVASAKPAAADGFGHNGP